MKKIGAIFFILAFIGTSFMFTACEDDSEDDEDGEENYTEQVMFIQ